MLERRVINLAICPRRDISYAVPLRLKSVGTRPLVPHQSALMVS